MIFLPGRGFCHAGSGTSLLPEETFFDCSPFSLGNAALAIRFSQRDLVNMVGGARGKREQVSLQLAAQRYCSNYRRFDYCYQSTRS